MDVKKVVAVGLIILTVLVVAAPAGAWFGPFGGFGFGCSLFGYPVPVPVAVPATAPIPAAIPAGGLC